MTTADPLSTVGETIGGGVLQQPPGGKGANQAVAAARLGGSARMIGAVGDDAQGRLMVQSIYGAGVDTADVAVLDGGATGTVLIVVRDGENQIVVCPGANSGFSLAGVEFSAEEKVLCQLEVGLPVVLEAARRSMGFFVLYAAPAMDLPAKLLERCELVIVNESEYQLIPALADAKLVAVTHGKDGSGLLERGWRRLQPFPCRWRTLSVPVTLFTRLWSWRSGRGFLRPRACGGERCRRGCRGRSLVPACPSSPGEVRCPGSWSRGCRAVYLAFRLARPADYSQLRRVHD
jgi:ribokinase